MRVKSVVFGSVMVAYAALLAQTAHADSVSDLKTQLNAVEAQLRLIESQSQNLSPAAIKQLNQVKTELDQLRQKVAEAEAQAASKATPSAEKQAYAAAVAKEPVPATGGIPIWRTPKGSFFIGGTFDAGVQLDSGTHTKTVLALNTGLMRSSRLTLEGYYELPWGLRAAGIIQGGVNLSTGQGNSDPANVSGNGFTFGRYDMVGLELPRAPWGRRYGEIGLGRQYNPLWTIMAPGDPFAGNYLGGIGVLAPAVVRTNRVSNSIQYTYNYGWEGSLNSAPKHGVGFSAMYAPGQGAGGPVSTDSGRQFGASISYGAQDWWLGAGYHQTDGHNSTDTSPDPLFTPTTSNGPELIYQAIDGFYDFSRLFPRLPTQLFAGVSSQDNGLHKPRTSGGIDTWSWWTGLTLRPFRPQNVVHVLYGSAYDQTPTKGQWSTLQLSYEYDFTSRFAWYLEDALVFNNSNAAQTVTFAHNVLSNGELTANGVTPAFGATGNVSASGFRFNF